MGEVNKVTKEALDKHRAEQDAAYANAAERRGIPPGLDFLRTQMQETGSIATGGGFDLAWLLLFLSDLGIDENSVFIDVDKRRIEVVR